LGRRDVVARLLAQQLLDQGWQRVTVDPYVWNERALRAWAKAGFVEESRHPADDGHASEWALMRFSG
jgi:RimJ/RimL family protein N-acetyltransferase